MKKTGKNLIIPIICWLISAHLPLAAQSIDSSLLNAEWKASWIAVPGESATEYGVYLFRKKFIIDAKPANFFVHVSGDNRYKLYINEQLVSLGPARGDIDHWNFETVDLAPYLHAGINLIAAKVWNESEWRPEGQISLRTGFILQGNDKSTALINTDTSWKCVRDHSYHPLAYRVQSYYVAGPGEQVNLNNSFNGWECAEFPDAAWKSARVISNGIPKGLLGGYGTVHEWLLKPSVIPQMELTPQRLNRIVHAEGSAIPHDFPSKKIPVTIAAHSIVRILLDQGFLTNAYPELTMSGGKNASVSLCYAEALYTSFPSKGNRNETKGKFLMGRKDSIISNGAANQFFTSLAYRTYRYIELLVRTNDEALTIEDLTAKATGYPFKLNAALHGENPELNQILDIGWRTARLCAMETYMDCPYYEQLQYIGDARIQAMVSLYNSGDERLLKNAMNEMDNSRRPEGITLSRHPSYTPQYIPTFSLWYIGMLHDYMMYGSDSLFVKNKLAGERMIMQYFRNYQLPDGSLHHVPYWMFSDWVEKLGWKSGVAPAGTDGCSSVIDLQLLWAYQLAADMETRLGMPSYAVVYSGFAEQLKTTIRNKYWDTGKRLFADTEQKNFFSQHANALAILTGVTVGAEATQIARQLITDTSLAPASIYFKYYLHMALVSAGLGNDYISWLGQWRDNVKMGLTTWAEISDLNNARSDCHAWGSSPNIEFFRTVLGIDSESPGFDQIKIEPHLGALTKIGGEMPHPKGKLTADYSFENKHWNIQLGLPPGTSGHFIWGGKTYALTTGINKFSF